MDEPVALPVADLERILDWYGVAEGEGQVGRQDGETEEKVERRRPQQKPAGSANPEELDPQQI